MKTSLILYVVASLILSSLLVSSCKKDPVDNHPGGPPGAHANDADRAIPYSYPDWMANIDASKYLSEITIPGTHDCGADLHTSEQGTMSDVTIAQDFRISNQLLMGVRWFDVRLHDDEGIMTVFHGPYYLHKNFTDVVLQALAFLDTYKTETVIFMIKQEHSDRGDDAFANGVLGYLNWAHPDRFWMGDYIPQLKNVRGKVVITRQFWGTHGYEMGVPLWWNDNTTGSFGASDNGIYVYVQDHYSLNTVSFDTKISEIENCISKAHTEPYPYRCYYLNFTSGEATASLVPLQDIAAYINPRINTFLLSNPTWHNCGVIFVNFAGGSDDGEVPNDLVKTIVNMNSFADSVTIGSQIWMKKNLNVTHFRNGDPITNVTGNTAWGNLTTGAYCDYNNSSGNSTTYGRLYNWYAVTDPRGLCPNGWHVPAEAEWNTLLNSQAGGPDVCGEKLKERGTLHWMAPNDCGTNETNFTALPAGYRAGDGTFSAIKSAGFWWSKSMSSAYPGYASLMDMGNEDCLASLEYSDKTSGFSVRCVKD